MSKPSAPKIGRATLGTNGNTITVSWTRLTTTGITSYKIVSLPATNTTTAAASASSATISGLHRGVAYTFKVAAVNSAGVGAFSLATNSVTIPVTVPGAPVFQGVQNALGSTSATITWSPPVDDGGSEVTTYNIQCDQPSIPTLVVDAPATSATITGLSDSTSYVFTISATNAQGTGPLSAPSTSIAPVYIAGKDVITNLVTASTTLQGNVQDINATIASLADTSTVTNLTCTNLHVNAPITSYVGTGLAPSSSSQVGYTHRQASIANSTISDAIRTVMTSTFSPPVGVWLITGRVSLDVAAGSTANTVNVPVYIDADTYFNFVDIPDNNTAVSQSHTVNFSVVHTNSTKTSGAPVTVAAVLVRASTTTQITTHADANTGRYCHLHIVRLA